MSAAFANDPEGRTIRARLAAYARVPERAGEAAALQRELAIRRALRAIGDLGAVTAAEKRRITGTLRQSGRES